MATEAHESNKDKKEWESPVLSEIDISETANGMIGNDGSGMGGNNGGNMSGS